MLFYEEFLVFVQCVNEVSDNIALYKHPSVTVMLPQIQSLACVKS